MNTLDKGKEGEDMACAYLKKQGYRIRHRNFYHQKAEIDIIVSKDDTLAIVEVKWRLTDFFGAPETFVTPKKRKLLARAADFYVQKFNWQGETRFDIISIVGQPPNHTLTHIEQAFYFV
ncbi:MAG: YraN family protein [Flavobacteriaceae bacterium]|jgi:putative endonuclease|nr:YraN family protein [Flavobacteriaceae bacterium]MDG2290652.1 YraN family protein [Flavobacteriaceae bacterium]